ncbi:16S rRNA (cytosine(1402)-N(4))-methyltransferase RsmH [Sansalvadorimonas sp. 2012CJ34-2]|uniref:Ribosomal RNA small subunit methyltransferase H n=1 Tax=Parendozoicomonas callyspongiae TaxID=2942213 RepID=A0ABT0PEL0_9GAMM|nr:16S rRNA (cytosine(1402)-N(4))-methyltransferase RsmH [Sansalvadorimonas sp. 2012CJ34-2]MCL6268978.1 16S rRNA (cytosine(1402)-N(4))-methyltransferase RsmH [Sansalvadorimonas sp. 2012CJ34-2]
MSKQFRHKTVLLDEAIECLVQTPDGHYIDGTFGRGGHSRLILSQLDENGLLTGIDKDPVAIGFGEALMEEDKRFRICHGSFAEIKTFANGEKLDGILLDLGVSSPQLDDAARGFSFLRDGPLDMRMNTSKGMSAAQWLAVADEDEITDVIKRFGEEKFGRRMAKAIIEARQNAPIETTARLAKIIANANPVWPKKIHPATKAFQGIRIFINSELDDLERLLEDSLELLKPGGRLVIISFHSLEDRIVKRFIRRHEKGDDVPSWVPLTDEQLNRKLKSVGKARKPGPEEVDGNPRARSAVMRVAERLA